MANKVDTVYRKALEEAKALDIEGGDVRWLIMEAEGYHSPADVIYFRDKEMRHEDLFWSYWEKRKSGLPVQYVTGKAPFLGFDLFVDQRVLIPRQETEEMLATLSERIYDYYDPRNYLVAADIGTGSGCIAWALACAAPGVEVSGLDISSAALAVAASQDIRMPEGCLRPEFILYDVLSGESGLDAAFGATGHAAGSYAAFDIIVSNPPYVRESEKPLMHRNVLEYEPGLALFVPDSDPLVFYRAIAGIAGTRLRQDGFGAVEINEAFGDAVAGIFSDAGFRDVRKVEDFRAKIRFVTFRK